MSQLITKFIANGAVTAAKLATITDGITLDQSGSGSTIEIKTGGISNTQINSAAAIALSKLATLTASRAVATDVSGILVASTTTSAELGFVSGVTSSIQTQLNSKQSSLIFSDSLVNTGGTVTLVGDTASPTASQYYGTDGSSTLGYYNLPSPGTGTVTSVALTVPSFLSVSGSPITTSGTLAISLNTESANTVFAGPSSGSAAIPTFRSLVSADIPSLSSIYLPLAGGTMSGAINGGGFEALNFGTPTVSSSLATKGYVDAAIAGLTWKGPVQAYATNNIPLTGSTPLVIDGYTVVDADLLLLSAQTISSQDGEYSVAITGGSYVLTANGLPDSIGDAWLVEHGTLYSNSAFVATAAVPAATFVQFAGPQTLVFSAPLSLSGNTVSITRSSTSVDGYLSAADFTTFNNKQPAGNYITALTGDAIASGPGSAALTLATVNSNVGSFGSSTSIPSFTVNAKGLITAASGNVVIAPAGTLTGATLNSSVISSSLTSVGTLTSGSLGSGFTAVAIAQGGTGQVTAPAAYNALSPMTTIGDIEYEVSANTAARLAIGSTGQVLTVVGGVPAWTSTASTLTNNKETFTLSSGDITNQFIDLSNVVKANSIQFNVQGGPIQLEGSSFDYTVSLTGGAGGNTRITFVNGLATGGISALVAGDVLQIQYQF